MRKHARTNIALYIHVRTGEKRIMQIMIEKKKKERDTRSFPVQNNAFFQCFEELGEKHTEALRTR